MNKIFVLDTNILLYDPQAIFKFGKNTISIPITVIEEIDKFKKDVSEVGRNARTISRILDGLRAEGKLLRGVKLPDGGILKVELGIRGISRIPFDLERDTPDNRILSTALFLKEKNQDVEVFFITKDINLRIKADALGLIASDYESGRVEIDELYSGITEIQVAREEIDRLYKEGIVPPEGNTTYFNEYFLVKDKSDPSHMGMGRFDAKQAKIVPIVKPTQSIFGIYPKNTEQSFVMDALLNQDIKLITMVGKAGTGKTLLAIAAGLHMAVDLNYYEKLLISRPIFPLGRDIGYLPGDIEEKLNPWMKPIYDNMELLLSTSHYKKKKSGKVYKELLEMGVVEIEPLTYIRGRSIPNQFLIIDEAQNLTPLEVKTILTRVGYGSKIIFTGDPYQIDNPYVDSSSNGLSYLVEKFKSEPMSAHVTLRKGERSELAERAANLL